MKVEVQRLNEKGRILSALERVAMPKSRGWLRIVADRDERSKRAAIAAELVSDADSAEPQLLPLLMHAVLVQAGKWQLLIVGVETIDGTQYAQTWHAKVQPC